MQAVLTQINTVPGIVGSMICDEDGRLAARVFPQLFDNSMMEEAAAALADSILGLQGMTGGIDMIDFRYSDARIVIRPMSEAILFLLCTKTVNMQLLAISLNVATKKLEKLFEAYRTQQAAVTAAPAQTTPSAAVIAMGGKKVDGVPLTIQAMNSSANTFWDNMIETVSINRSTSILISDYFKTGSFKKVVLTNPANGRSKKFPVYIIKNDAERIFEGKALVSLASMESLGVTTGDQVVAKIVIGGGYLGWEGI
jgi:predicted regulator of Ras-like GTPase activity (Roadblock/LC7/MglB family)